MVVRGIRGAVQVEANDRDEISSGALKLVRLMAEENGVQPADVAYVYFTVTQDLTADFPARGIRTGMKGWEQVPLLCSQEIAVPGAMERLVRVLMLVNTEKPQAAIRHSYLGSAAKLRPDLGDKS